MECVPTGAASGSEADSFHHAFFYRGVDEYVRAIVTFVRGDETRRSPALVAVPGRKLSLLRALLDDGLHPVTFADMDELGRNPARLTALMRRFVEGRPTVPLHLVTEAVSPGVPAATYREIVFHEAVLARVLAGSAASVLCPVDAGTCAPEVLEDVVRTHPHVAAGEEPRASRSYDPTLAAALFDRRLPGVPPTSPRQSYDRDGLAELRRFVEAGATRAGLIPARVQDLVLAANEVATNTVVHAEGPGVVHLWTDRAASEVVCDLSDRGHIAQPLVGRIEPSPLSRHGWGLWMVNQVCDLVEMRSGRWGTNVRLHMRLA